MSKKAKNLKSNTSKPAIYHSYEKEVKAEDKQAKTIIPKNKETGQKLNEFFKKIEKDTTEKAIDDIKHEKIAKLKEVFTAKISSDDESNEHKLEKAKMVLAKKSFQEIDHDHPHNQIIKEVTSPNYSLKVNQQIGGVKTKDGVHTVVKTEQMEILKGFPMRKQSHENKNPYIMENEFYSQKKENTAGKTKTSAPLDKANSLIEHEFLSQKSEKLEKTKTSTPLYKTSWNGNIEGQFEQLSLENHTSEEPKTLMGNNNLMHHLSKDSFEDFHQYKSPEPYKCSSFRTESEKFNELIHYIMMKKIQIIPIRDVRNDGKILGEGGFGVVYEGEWDCQKVAIKEMFISYDEFKVMDSELDFMGKFRFPRLVTLYGIYIQEIRSNKLQCGFIMELMKNDLETYLYSDPNADKSLKKKIKILVDIMKALAHLHKNGVVHRDIKPKNVLLDLNDEAKLTDLGIAKVLENKEKTESATIAFTARYVSREAAIESITSFSNDIWSFGLLMYEILMEKRPWGMINNAKILIFLNNKESPFEKGWEDTVDKQLVDIVLKCTKYCYESRETAENILNELVAYAKKI